MPDGGTIDITNLVATVKDSWIRWATRLVTTTLKAIPYGIGAFFSLPVISNLTEYFVGKLVKIISDGVEMESFFLNTAVRKASQAQDYVDAVTALKALPETASDEEYEHAEQIEMAAFRNFVRVTN